MVNYLIFTYWQLLGIISEPLGTNSFCNKGKTFFHRNSVQNSGKILSVTSAITLHTLYNKKARQRITYNTHKTCLNSFSRVPYRSDCYGSTNKLHNQKPVKGQLPQPPAILVHRSDLELSRQQSHFTQPQQQEEQNKGQYSRGPPAFLYSLSGAGPLGPPSEGPVGHSES